MKKILGLSLLVVFNNFLFASERAELISLREYVNEHQKQQSEMQTELQKLRNHNIALQTQLEQQQTNTMKIWIVGGVVCMGIAGIASYFVNRIAQHDRRLELQYKKTLEISDQLYGYVGLIVDAYTTKLEVKQIIADSELKDNLAFLLLKDRVLDLERTALRRY